MAHTWSPEQIQQIEIQITAARAGDVYAAVSLLHRTVHCLDRDLPFPEPLRLYLLDAFRQIAKTTPADLEKLPVVIAASASMIELQKCIMVLEETRDANAAFNLKHQGRRRSRAVTIGESFLIGSSVSTEMENKGKSWEEAIGAVAERLGVSDRTVSRAWSRYKKIPGLHDKK